MYVLGDKLKIMHKTSWRISTNGTMVSTNCVSPANGPYMDSVTEATHVAKCAAAKHSAPRRVLDKYANVATKTMTVIFERP